MTTDWISVKDRLPEQSGYYRIILRYDSISGSGQHKTTAYFSLAYKRWGLRKFDNITHWLEEPPMPEVTE